MMLRFPGTLTHTVNCTTDTSVQLQKCKMEFISNFWFSFFSLSVFLAYVRGFMQMEMENLLYKMKKRLRKSIIYDEFMLKYLCLIHLFTLLANHISTLLYLFRIQPSSGIHSRQEIFSCCYCCCFFFHFSEERTKPSKIWNMSW